MRWKSLCGGLALLLAAAAGCKQRLFINQDDYDKYKGVSIAALESSPTIHAEPTTDVPPTPPTVRNPEREIRNITLAECVALALEHGIVGSAFTALAGSGQPATEAMITFSGQGTVGSDAIRVLALDPAAVGAGIEASLSKFDATFLASMNWSGTDRPVGTALDLFQTGGSQLQAIVQEQATFSTSVIKPLPTGGVAGITFNLPYTLTNLAAATNPAYTPQLQFQFEQPLLQGFGVEINELRASHPGSILSPGAFNTQPTAEGILVTRIRFDQERADFERNVHAMLTNVEIAYWNLYSSYWSLYSQDSAVRFSYEAWRINKARFDAGKISIADFAQTRGQYEQFRQARILALNNLLTNERQLRLMIGLPMTDGKRLVPADEPTLAPFQPNWDAAARDALNLRPELYIARQDVKANQMNVIVAKNNLLPDLRFTATYDINDIGNRLDGPDSNNALRNLASDHFNNWALGLRLNIPIGYRSQEASLRINRLRLARSYEVLKDQEQKALDNIDAAYQRIFSTYDQIGALRAQREAFAEQLKARFQEFIAGRGTLDIFLEAQRFWAQALDQEFQAVRDYNNALVSFEYCRGRILEHDGVVISEGPVPACAQKRAADHIRERALALPLRERAALSACPDGPPPLQAIPQPGTGSLPAALNNSPALTQPPPPPLPPTAAASGRPGDPKGMTRPPADGPATPRSVDLLLPPDALAPTKAP
jgi:outer membrane protein TolC